MKFIEQASEHHQTIKFTAEVSKTETNFLDTTVYKGERLKTESVQMYAPTLSPLKHFSTPIFNLPSLRGKTLKQYLSCSSCGKGRRAFLDQRFDIGRLFFKECVVFLPLETCWRVVQCMVCCGRTFGAFLRSSAFGTL